MTTTTAPKGKRKIEYNMPKNAKSKSSSTSTTPARQLPPPILSEYAKFCKQMRQSGVPLHTAFDILVNQYPKRQKTPFRPQSLGMPTRDIPY